MLPPPTKTAWLMVWCGARNGRCLISGVSGGSCVGHRVNFGHIQGFFDGHFRQDAGHRPRQQGLPGSRDCLREVQLCPPAAATSSARLTCSCPLTSAKSVGTNRGGSSSPEGWKGSIKRRPVRWSYSCASVLTGIISRSGIRAASAASTSGTAMRLYPLARAAAAIGKMPRVCRTTPSSESSPTTRVFAPFPAAGVRSG